MTDRDKIKAAAFDAWQSVNRVQFWMLQANLHGKLDNLQRVRDDLAKAVASLDGVLAPPAPDTEGAPV